MWFQKMNAPVFFRARRQLGTETPTRNKFDVTIIEEQVSPIGVQVGRPAGWRRRAEKAETRRHTNVGAARPIDVILLQGPITAE